MSDLTTEEQAILLERTAALARSPVAVAEAEGEPAIFFRVGRRRCCALARSVRAAVRLEAMVPVPHAPRALAGAIVRGGAAIPVFHLAALVSERLGRLPETAHGLVLGEQHDEVALAVDAIDGFGAIDRAALVAPPDEIRSAWVVAATPAGESFVDLDALRAGPALWVDAGQIRTEPR
ncbi:MAG: chemotaxis protein CheW [Labilithrix sp.]|nr:chemotaxis protein CheW [Labilithrix sp.]MCW5817470.1 chemotaxis protein CheW [Labilithrix sp.]